MKYYRYYYRPNGDIDFKYNYKGNQIKQIYFVNNLPFVETTEDYDISKHCVDVSTKTIIAK